MSYNITIIGAGPSGLTLGILLKKLGYETCIIEKNLNINFENTKAVMIHSASLEIFDEIGIVDKIIKKGIKQEKIIFSSPKRDDIYIDFSTLKNRTKYNYYINLVQPELEKILLDKYIDLGGTIYFNTEVESIDGSHGFSQLSCKSGNNNRLLLTHNYIIGCDGANSFIRKFLEIPFEGTTYDYKYILVEGKLKLKENMPKFSSMSINNQVVLSILPLTEDTIRIAGPGSFEKNSSINNVKDFNNFLSNNNLDYLKVEDEAVFRKYNVNERVAKVFVKNKFILCGDAAHIHSPAGGQAMNQGILDAYTLYFLLLNGYEQPYSIYQKLRMDSAKNTLNLTNFSNFFDDIRNPNKNTASLQKDIDDYALKLSQLVDLNSLNKELNYE